MSEKKLILNTYDVGDAIRSDLTSKIVNNVLACMHCILYLRGGMLVLQTCKLVILPVVSNPELTSLGKWGIPHRKHEDRGQYTSEQ